MCVCVSHIQHGRKSYSVFVRGENKRDRRSVLVIKLVFIVLRKTCFHTTPVFCLLSLLLNIASYETNEDCSCIHTKMILIRGLSTNSLYFSPFLHQHYFYTLFPSFTNDIMSNPTTDIKYTHNQHVD